MAKQFLATEVTETVEKNSEVSVNSVALFALSLSFRTLHLMDICQILEPAYNSYTYVNN